MGLSDDLLEERYLEHGIGNLILKNLDYLSVSISWITKALGYRISYLLLNGRSVFSPFKMRIITNTQNINILKGIIFNLFNTVYFLAFILE